MASRILNCIFFHSVHLKTFLSVIFSFKFHKMTNIRPGFINVLSPWLKFKKRTNSVTNRARNGHKITNIMTRLSSTWLKNQSNTRVFIFDQTTLFHFYSFLIIFLLFGQIFEFSSHPHPFFWEKWRRNFLTGWKLIAFML